MDRGCVVVSASPSLAPPSPFFCRSPLRFPPLSSPAFPLPLHPPAFSLPSVSPSPILSRFLLSSFVPLPSFPPPPPPPVPLPFSLPPSLRDSNDQSLPPGRRHSSRSSPGQEGHPHRCSRWKTVPGFPIVSNWRNTARNQWSDRWSFSINTHDWAQPSEALLRQVRIRSISGPHNHLDLDGNRAQKF